MPTDKEKSTVYIREDLKLEVQTKLLKERKSLTELINELLEQWNKNH